MELKFFLLIGVGVDLVERIKRVRKDNTRQNKMGVVISGVLFLILLFMLVDEYI